MDFLNFVLNSKTNVKLIERVYYSLDDMSSTVFSGVSQVFASQDADNEVV